MEQTEAAPTNRRQPRPRCNDGWCSPRQRNRGPPTAEPDRGWPPVESARAARAFFPVLEHI